MSRGERDELFRDGRVDEDFRFTERVAEVFDDMLARSIPNYGQVTGMTAALIGRFLAPGERVYDLGCSTGATLIELCRRLDNNDLRFVGVDSSAAMIAKARRKAKMYTKQDRIEFIEADILELPLAPAGAAILNYTLQFIRPMHRLAFLSRLHKSLRPGGLLIVSEKTIAHDPAVNRAFIEFYHDFKRQQGYSEMEIAAKREALENVLIPFSIEENLDLLHQAGFKSVEPFHQWFNFVSLLAIK